MPKRAQAPTGAPCWIDLWTSDVEGSRRFYSELFGWEAAKPSAEHGGYFMFMRDGAPVAGCMGSMAGMEADNSWKVYLASEDAERTAKLAEATGGRARGAVMRIDDMGVQAVLIDNAGAVVGVWQPIDFPGLTVLAEHGAPGWFELATSQYGASLEFYRAVFACELKTMADTEDFRYTMVHDSATGTDLAGIMDTGHAVPSGTPAQWSVYLGCDDADVVAARARELGGTVLRAPEDTPYGRLATLADPAGAVFKLVGANEMMPAPR
jgi:predicted enzyme related to lactoylglutathione lyase